MTAVSVAQSADLGEEVLFDKSLIEGPAGRIFASGGYVGISKIAFRPSSSSQSLA